MNAAAVIIDFCTFWRSEKRELTIGEFFGLRFGVGKTLQNIFPLAPILN